jgi:hypothetical protein
MTQRYTYARAAAIISAENEQARCGRGIVRNFHTEIFSKK